MHIESIYSTFQGQPLTLNQDRGYHVICPCKRFLDISRTQTIVESLDLYHIVENSKAFTGT